MKYLLIICLFGYFSLANQSNCENRQLNGCKIYEYILGSHILHCNNVDARLDGFINSSFCRSENLYFDLNGNEILDKSFDFESISKLKINQLTFENLKGIDVNAAADFKNINPMQYLSEDDLMNLVFLDSRLVLYENGQQLENFEILKRMLNVFTIFQFYSSPRTNINFENLSNKNKIYPIIFNNVEVSTLSFYNMENTFYRKSSLEFMKSNETDHKTKIKIVYFYECHQFDFDDKILNPTVFKEVKEILFYGTIHSIQVDVFKPFKNLKRLEITITYVESMLRRIGIEWMKRLNSDIKVNISNQVEILNKRGFIFELCFIENDYNREERNYNNFQNEDFCLYRDFPFEQLVLFETDYFHKQPTCTDLWLYQVYEPISITGFDGWYFKDTYLKIIEYLKNQSLINS